MHFSYLNKIPQFLNAITIFTFRTLMKMLLSNIRLSITCIILLTGSGLYGQSKFFSHLADSAVSLTKQNVTYDASYFRLSYPNGDVPPEKGVCTDVIIRAYRKMGIDLQQEVHEDMNAHFSLYPQIWGMKQPDKNIDHRRVPNLMTFFTRHGMVKAVSKNAGDYAAGDIVCWKLGGGVNHIGLVSNKRSSDGKRFLIVHNIGSGQVLEDCLFNFTIIGHYRYTKKRD